MYDMAPKSIDKWLALNGLYRLTLFPDTRREVIK